jgi:hypothetical protein
VRASAGISTTPADIDRFLAAVTTVVSAPPSIRYLADPISGDYWPEGLDRPDAALSPAAGCGPG